MESSGSGDGADSQQWEDGDGAAGAGRGEGQRVIQEVVDARAGPGVTRKRRMSGVGTSSAPVAWGEPAQSTSDVEAGRRRKGSPSVGRRNCTTNQRWLSRNSVSCDFESAPTEVPMTAPLRNSISVGMPRTPNRCAIDWLSSTLSLAT